MRLICPRCGAQYEIDPAAIPAGGRDVECSACEHVWRASGAAQTGTGPQSAADSPLPAPAAGEAPGFDPAARPALSRPLNDSVLDILREEAARELDARAAERNARRATHRTAAALAGIGTTRPTPADLSPADRSDDAHTLTGDAPDDSGNGTGDAAPAHAAGAGTAQGVVHPTTAPPAEAASRDGALPSDRRAAAPTESAPRHAAGSEQRMHLPSADARPAAAARPSAAQRQHDAGFHLALMVALIAVALYAVAPRLADQGQAGAALMRWHTQVDQARDWLADQGDRLIASLKKD